MVTYQIGDLVAVQDTVGVIDDVRTLGPNREVLPRVANAHEISSLFRNQYRVRDLRMQAITSGINTRYPDNRWLETEELCLIKHGPLYDVLNELTKEVDHA